jgi:type I restriction enzyme S subunit
MSSEWREATWGDEISLEYGKGIRGYQDAVASVPVFGTNGQVGWTEEPLAPGPGIILGRKGAYRGIHFSKIPFFVIDTAYYVKPKSALHMRWLYYSMIHHQLGSIDDGSPIPSTTRAAVYVRKFKVPDSDTQRATAKILGDLDDKIDLLRQMNATLEETARAMFRAWFVDFEPVRAKVAGATSFRGMPQTLFDQLPGSFTSSELGNIPTGWTVEQIGSLAECVGGGTPSTKNPAFWNEGVHAFCTPKDMSRQSSFALWDTERYLTDMGVENISSGALPVGTVLLSSRAPIGYIAINYRPVSINQGIIGVKPTVLPVEYLRFWLETNMETIKANAGGTTFAEISKSKFRLILALRPNQEPVAVYSQLTRHNLERIAANELEIQTLATLRDTLLPKLISGELPTPALDAIGLKPTTAVEVSDGG